MILGTTLYNEKNKSLIILFYKLTNQLGGFFVSKSEFTKELWKYK